MTKAELESKSLSDLHSLAAEASVPKFRMLSRRELVDRLAGGSGDSGDGAGSGGESRSGGGERSRREGGERPRRRRRRSGEGSPDREPRPRRERSEQPAREDRDDRGARAERGRDAGEGGGEAASTAAAAGSERPRRRRRRRFGRRGKEEVTLQGLLLPAEGRQALLCAEGREACTALLRSVAADLSADSKGPDPVALLIDPGPEELADWKRDAPQAEIVSAGQPRHASDALAQAKSRAAGGEDVILLVDSLTRLAEAYGEAAAAKEFFDAGRTTTGSGTLTVVAALERPSA
jgi:hypothetical protein